MNSVIQKLNDLGYQTIDGAWYDRVADWDSWYKGNVEKFRNYTVWNGQGKVKCARYSLGMAKKVCEDWANLLMNEKVKITLEGRAEQDFIDDIFTRCDFEVSANELQEKGAARGTYAIVPRVQGVSVNERGDVTGGGEIYLDFLTAERIFPLSWTGREITECAFSTLKTEKDNKYVILQIHHLDGGQYVIDTLAYQTGKSGGETLTEVDLSSVPGLEAVSPSYDTHSDRPQYVIGRYNIANNIEDDNPMGVAVFANAIDVLKACDIVYDSYVNEFLLGKKRIMVKPSATKMLNGDDVFDPNDVTFYVLPEDVSDGSVIQPIDMSLRVGDHTNGLQEQLNLLSSKCGFGERHYRFDSGSVSTATQIISENSEMFRTIKKHEIVLESFIVSLCRMLLRMGNEYLGMNLNEDVEISVDFDDSIIEDRQTEEARVYQMLSAGLMRADEARSILMNEDIETARKALPGMEDLTAGETQDEVE